MRQRVVVDGVHLCTREIRPDGWEGRPAIIFLHEALGGIEQWKHFPDELCEASQCRGIVYERQGHGQSDPLTAPRPLTFYRHEAEHVLPAVLDAFGVRSHVLFGHSDGGTIALQYAASLPERPLAVISEAAHVMIEEHTLEGIRAARQAWESTDLPQRLQRYHGENTERLFFAWADTWLDPAQRRWNMLPDLERIRAPLLLIQGDDDRYGTRAQVEAIASRVRGRCETMLLPECGHVPHLEARVAVIHAVLGFLTQLPEWYDE